MDEILWYLRTVYHPRAAVKHFVSNKPRIKTLMLLVAAYGVLAYLDGTIAGEKPAAITPIFFVIAWLGASGGAYSVGRVLGGKATVAFCLIAMALTFVVPIVFMPLSIPLNYLAAQQTSVNLTPFELGLLICGLVVSLWWVVVSVAAISEAHGLTIAKSLITFVAAFVAGALLVALSVFLLAIILRPMT